MKNIKIILLAAITGFSLYAFSQQSLHYQFSNPQPATLVSQLTGTDTICNGAANGYINSQVTGGTQPYTYLWSNDSTTSNIQHLTSNIYYLTVTDAHNCTANNSFSIYESLPVVTSNITGSLQVVEQEIKQYFVTQHSGSTYQWAATNGSILSGQGTNTVFVQWGTNGFGTLQVIETNSLGCIGNMVSVNVAIGNVIPCDSMEIAVTGQNIICNGQCNGIASVQVLHGNPPYTYIWNDPYYQQVSTISNLCPGTYSVTVTDHYNCTESGTYIVTQPNALTLNVTTISASCGQHNGSATVSVTGGTQPYYYAWTSGDTLATADSLEAGMYMVTVTDAHGCSKFTLATVSNTNGPVITAHVITNLTCYESGNGAINITVSGGTTPYAFSWTTGATTEDISNLTAGPYEIEITDFTGCMATASYFVSQPNQVNAVATTTPASCGNTNGVATITVTGGTQPYSFVWSNSGTGATQTGLAPGVYTVTITDSHSCTGGAPLMVSINTANGPVVAIDSVIQSGCSGNDGAIYVSVSGGNPPYTYNWSDSSHTQDIVQLAPGNYQLTVTDSLGCIGSTGATISHTQPATPQICIVTVDSIEHKNLIVWEKEVTTSIDYYNVYREGSWAGYYFLAGSKPYNSMSTFLDVNSNPHQRAYRYKITAVDFCGNESDASETHKTIHLAINYGVGNSWNLIWTEYEGFNFPGYYIYRHTNSDGWVLIDSIATGYNSYTDIPPNQGQINYMVTVRSPQICSPTGTKDMSGPFSQSLSNIEDNGIIDEIQNIQLVNTIKIYPNPVSNELIIENYSLSETNVELLNIVGQTLYCSTIGKHSKINMITMPSGVYILKIHSEKGTVLKKIVKQ
ncbi:MAG: T9SS type A sorting domain-containing protein [Bacteroidia bacterium]|nr:T9SS type A sorting domain-containing protein [Bacteroidia bacterium]